MRQRDNETTRQRELNKNRKIMSAKYYGIEKVGETFEYKGKKYRVMNGARGADVCLMCDLHNVKDCRKMRCMPSMREDYKENIYYKEVK